MKQSRLGLVILAAGMGSRYGGTKQLEGVGPNNETLIEYSVYNAYKAGFNTFIFVVRNDINDTARDFFSRAVPTHCHVEFVVQDLTSIPPGYVIPPERTKPLGTGHALLLCKPYLDCPFAMINGDDFYDIAALTQIANFLKTQAKDIHHYALVGYELGNTLSPFGTVSRGICRAKDGILCSLEEHKKIEKTDSRIYSYPDDESKAHILDAKEPVSMNLFGFSPPFFEQLESGFHDFLRTYIQDMSAEFFVPAYLGELIAKNQANVSLLTCTAEWFGITYPQDTPYVKERITDLIAKKQLPPTIRY